MTERTITARDLQPGMAVQVSSNDECPLEWVTLGSIIRSEHDDCGCPLVLGEFLTEYGDGETGPMVDVDYAAFHPFELITIREK